MKRTPAEIYEYESKRIDQYKDQFVKLVESTNVSEEYKERFYKLFEWYGHARAIKSKAYQKLKKARNEK